MNRSNKTSILPASTTALLQKILLASNHSEAIDLRIVKRLRLVKSISAQMGVPVPILGTAPLFEDVKLITQTQPNWAFYNVSHDPLWQAGRFPVPRRHLNRLKQLYYGGAEFDALYVAHELPSNFDPVMDPLDLGLIEPAPSATSLHLARTFGVVSDTVVKTYAAAIRKPTEALAAAGKAGVARLTDPILMGALVSPGVNPEPGVQATWFLLAAWSW